MPRPYVLADMLQPQNARKVVIEADITGALIGA